MSGRGRFIVTAWLACAAGTVVADEPARLSQVQPVIQPVVLLDGQPAAGGQPSVAKPAGEFGEWRLLAALGGAFAMLAAFRFFSQRRPATLPPDVFEVLGSAPLAGAHAVRIVRFGPKTLLVGVSSAGATTLAEITDPQATALIAAACRGQARPTVGIKPLPKASALLACMLASCCWAALSTAAVAADGDVPPSAVAPVASDSALGGLESLLGVGAIEAVLPSALAFGVMSLAPAVLLMTTCFVRMSVVLALLRQGLGAPQIPSNQILASLAIFLSALVMWPVWTQAWRDGVEPCRQGTLAPAEAFEKGSLPIRRWMAAQIEQAGNRDTMLLFLQRHPTGPQRAATYDDVPVEALLPAFLVSELETAFAIGFRLLLPFLVLDILVATLVVSTGLVMLPPTLVSLPLKLLVFVAADGWTLVVRSLLDGVRAATG
jgi:flagellar biosynthetic protein FliP